MGLSAEWVPLGRPASERLAAVVAELKGGDPLAPVTVLVPSNPVGVWARRFLGGRPGGVANVEFTTIDRLAHDWGGPPLAAVGRSALTDQARAAAVRVALAAHRGSLDSVVGHPSTVRAVSDAIVVVRRAGDGARVLRRSGRPLIRDVLAVGDAVAAATPDHYDDVDLALAAAERVRTAGPVVVHLPEWLFPAQRALLAALGASADVHVLLGATGDVAADAAASGWLSAPRRGGAPARRHPGRGDRATFGARRRRRGSTRRSLAARAPSRGDPVPPDGDLLHRSRPVSPCPPSAPRGGRHHEQRPVDGHGGRDDRRAIRPARTRVGRHVVAAGRRDAARRCRATAEPDRGHGPAHAVGCVVEEGRRRRGPRSMAHPDQPGSRPLARGGPPGGLASRSRRCALRRRGRVRRATGRRSRRGHRSRRVAGPCGLAATA